MGVFEGRSAARACRVIAGGILVHLCLGIFYIFGNISPYMISYLRNRTCEHTLRNVDNLWINNAAQIVTPFAVTIGGLIDRQFGVRIATATGCIIFCSGVALTYFTINKSLVLVALTYGALTNFGSFIAYGPPAQCAVKWMPKRPGFAAGLIVCGSGGGALIFNQVVTLYINPNNLSPDLETSDGEKYFTNKDVLDRIPTVFLLLAGVYICLQCLGILLLETPPTDNKLTRVCEDDKNGTEQDDYEENKIAEVKVPVKTVLFKLLTDKNAYIWWFILFLLYGGMTIANGLYKAYGQTFIADDHFIALIGSLSAVFNCVFRPIWGILMDKYGFQVSVKLASACFVCLSCTIMHAESLGKVAFLLWICGLYGSSCYRTNMMGSMFPDSVWSMCLVGLLAVLVVHWAIQRWKYKYPRGPPGLPLLGNALQINQNKLHEQAYHWSKKYGPVIAVTTGIVPFVIVNTLETSIEVLVKKSTEFAGRQHSASLDALSYGGKDIAFSDYGPTWKLQKKITSKALRHWMKGGDLQTRVHDAVETAFVEIDQLPGEFDPTGYINFTVGNILTMLCFGGKFIFNDKEVTNVIEKEAETFEALGIGTWEDFIPGLQNVYKSEVFKIVEEFKTEVVDGYFHDKLKEAEKTFDKDNIRHFADTLILERKQAIEEECADVLKCLTDQHLVQTLADIFFGGLSTATLTLKNAILHMIAFPDIQEKVQEEIDTVVGRDRLPGIIDRPDLGYTEAVLHESMRLGTIRPFGLPHMTMCDTEVAGYRIPKGTIVMVNYWALHHDPDAWDEVDRFIPERFLDGNGNLGPKPKNWLPFSAGKRVCLGESVAKSQLHLIFACLMQRYKWRMVSGKNPDFTEVGGINGLFYKPYKVVAEKRI